MEQADSQPAPPPNGIAELLAVPDATRWASECGWLPGTGHCQNRDCGADCMFRAERNADEQRIRRGRQRRRAGRLGGFGRPCRRR